MNQSETGPKMPMLRIQILNKLLQKILILIVLFLYKLKLKFTF